MEKYKIKSINFNEADLITCFSNDFGYEKWMQKALEFYAEKKDVVILISTSGKSQNILNAAKYCKKKNIKMITFSGFNKNNKLIKVGDYMEIINHSNGIDKIANQCNTICDEILTSISKRVKRVYI